MSAGESPEGAGGSPDPPFPVELPARRTLDAVAFDAVHGPPCRAIREF